MSEGIEAWAIFLGFMSIISNLCGILRRRNWRLPLQWDRMVSAGLRVNVCTLGFFYLTALYTPHTSSLTKAVCRLSSYPLATNTQSTFAGVWWLPSVENDKVEGSPDKFLEQPTIWKPYTATRKDSSADIRNLITNHWRPPHATSCCWHMNKSYIYKNKYGFTEASVAQDDPKCQPSLQALFIITMTLQNNVAKRTRNRACHSGFWPWQQSTV